MSFPKKVVVLALVLFATLAAAPGTTVAQIAIPGGARQSSRQSGRDTVPSVTYFRAIERLYKGDYRDAERTFGRELRSSIKIGVTDRWIDSIAYHTMLGETYYQQGRMEAALQQFDLACTMFLQYPTWMIRVNFQREPVADINRLRQPLPWGKSNRQFTLGRFANQELIRITEVADQAVRQGATRGFQVQTPFRKLNVIEIVRATALAVRRRNELLGPLGAEDVISRALATAMARGNTIPNHWSKAWADLQRGLAYVGTGEVGQAEKYLRKSLLVRGRFDHPLSCVAMLELGRLKMEAGDLAAAGDFFAEASYSAFYYDDLGVIDEAFRLGTANHLAGGPKSLYPLLEPAAHWAGRKRYQHLSARLSLALSEESLYLGNVKAAQTTLSAAESRLRDAASGLLGNRALYLDACLQFHLERDSATAALSKAIQRHISMSTHNLQLQLTNQRYDQQQLRARSAVGVYQALLGDPKPVDWMLRPFETLAMMQTPHAVAFDRWFDAVLSRKNLAAALEISDLAKRHRFHNSLSWGGRLAALRDTLETPEHLLSQHARNQRNELLLRYPRYDLVRKEGQKLQANLRSQWQPDLDPGEQSDLVKTWRAWDKSLGQRETMLAKIGLQRAAADMQFPPVMPTTALQKKLQPGQAVVVFHETGSAMMGFLVTSTGSTRWQCASKKKLRKLLSQFLRDLGNYDANHTMTIADLLSEDWQKSGNKLFEALFKGSSLDPSGLKELIVVPDGLVWYVPFAALPVKTEEKNEKRVPLISISKIRMAPTVGLAVGHTQPWRRVQRTLIVGDDVLTGESSEENTEALAALRSAVENPTRLPEPSPIPTPRVGSLCETLVVLDEIEMELSKPLAWSPITQSRRSKKSSLSHWLTLPQLGPQRIVLPAARNVAERGGKIAKRKSAGAHAGTELFLASCGLMSTGAQTVLLSSWRVGGDATQELTREFLQELPYTTAAAAWQRSVQLAMELPLIPEQQPRVKVKKKDDAELTAAHPFFWAGYVLIDSGAPATAEETESSSPPVVTK